MSRDLLVNLLASVIAGTAVWVAQFLLRYQRLARKRAFFGLAQDRACLLAVSRHFDSPNRLSVHRRDVAALVELAAIARACGARADLIADGGAPQGVGALTEFCVGGPTTNPRTAAHLRAMLPGVRDSFRDGGRSRLPLTVGTTTFERDRGRVEYAVLARAFGPAGGHPVFVLNGQTAQANLAAARFLSRRHRQLYRAYRAGRPFCLVLRVVEPAAYGPDFVEIEADMTREAFTAPAAEPGGPEVTGPGVRAAEPGGEAAEPGVEAGGAG